MNETYRSRLKDIQPDIPAMRCRVSPASFDPAELLVLPRPHDSSWPSCAELLRALPAKGVVLCTPLYWQMHSMLSAAAQSARVPLFINEPSNVPLGAIAFTRAGVDTLIVENRTAPLYRTYLKDKKLQVPSLWLVIHRLTDAWDIPSLIDAPGVVAQEVHLAPAVPVLVQCIRLARARSQKFHAAEEYEIRITGEGTRISDISDTASVIQDYILPPLHVTGTCACGKSVYERAL